MIAVITGDIISSRKLKDQSVWLNPLKCLFNEWGTTPKHWEIFAGDYFQIEISEPQLALMNALRIKALIRSTSAKGGGNLKSEIDVRMVIGLGEKDYASDRISESNGSAFVFSGEKLEVLKREKNTLCISSANVEFDQQMNLYLKFAQRVMDNWSISSAELVQAILNNMGKNQSEIGQLLGIKQPSVSGRIHRAQIEEILEMEQFYRSYVNGITL